MSGILLGAFVSAEPFGERIRREIESKFGREKEGWFADHIGISRHQLSRTINGRVGVRPQPETILKIAHGLERPPMEVLRWSVADVFGEEEERSHTESRRAEEVILADLLDYLRAVAPPEAMDVLRELKEIESDAAYRAVVAGMAEAFAANMKMGGKMLRIKYPGRED